MNQYTLKQLFSIVDGRLSTNMEDVYSILDYLTGQSLMTHQLPTAMKWVDLKMPIWYIKCSSELILLKQKIGDKFEDLMLYIEANNTVYDIEPLTVDEMVGFENYMVDNSLLKQLGSAL